MGEVDDFDGFAHIDEVDFASIAHAAGVDDELGGFGDGHEVTGYLFVGDGDGAAKADLVAE